MRFGLFLLSLLMAAPAWAASPLDECSSARDIPVTVDMKIDQAGYDYNYGINAIQSMMAESQENHIHETLALGVTRYQPTLGVSMPIIGITLPSKLVCAHVEKVDVSVGYGQVMVYIAKEVPQGSCGFREIMAHEQKHINVNQQVLDEYAPRIKARIKDYIQSHGVFQQETADYAMGVLRADLNKIISEQLDDMSRENDRRQQLVDSRQEYERITNSCGGEIARISLQYLGDQKSRTPPY